MLKDASDRPLWISAEAAADEEKILDVELIDSEHLRSTVEKQRRELENRLLVEDSSTGKPRIATIPEAECKSKTLAVDDRGGLGSSDTLAHLATYSKTIVRGTVRTVDVGFASGTPSSLLGVEVSEVVKGAAPASPFYVDYPVAHFRIGPFSFCNANKGFEPQPGDEVLLFAYTDAVGKNEDLFAPRLDQLLFQGQDGTLFFPSPLKETPEGKTSRTLDDVVDRLQKLLSKEGGR